MRSASDQSALAISCIVGWMAKKVFVQWLERLDYEMNKSNRNILLPMDNNVSTHNMEHVELTNVRIQKLPKKTTSALQPLDAGVIDAFKQRFRKAQDKHVLSVLDKCEESGEDGDVSSLYKVDVQGAMEMGIEGVGSCQTVLD